MEHEKDVYFLNPETNTIEDIEDAIDSMAPIIYISDYCLDDVHLAESEEEAKRNCFENENELTYWQWRKIHLREGSIEDVEG